MTKDEATLELKQLEQEMELRNELATKVKDLLLNSKAEFIYTDTSAVAIALGYYMAISLKDPDRFDVLLANHAALIKEVFISASNYNSLMRFNSDTVN